MDSYYNDEQARRNSSIGSDESPLLGSHAKSLRITYIDTSCSKSTIQDAETQAPLYNVEYKFRNPNIRLSRAHESTHFGTATMHMFSNKIDVDVHGLGLKMKPTKDLRPNFTYSSAAMGGQDLTWESKNRYGYFYLVCVDQSQMPVAWVTTRDWKQIGFGRMEVRGDVWEDEAAREELLLTGLTLTYQTNMSKTPAYAPAQPKAMGMGSTAIISATSAFANIH